jgi:rare lipoprotein A
VYKYLTNPLLIIYKTLNRKMRIIITLIIGFVTLTSSLANQTGQASWYSIKCNGGTKTASGERLVDSAPTAAHKTLPMGTKVKVTNLHNGKSEIVKISDRGPYTKGRIIDVTVGVAERLGFKKNGVAKVKVEVVGKVK